MTHHLVLWGGFRLQPSRLWTESIDASPRRPAADDHDPLKRERAAAEVARLERDLENHGAGLGV